MSPWDQESRQRPAMRSLPAPWDATEWRRTDCCTTSPEGARDYGIEVVQWHRATSDRGGLPRG